MTNNPARYLILVREFQSVREDELCRVGSNPDAIVAALKKKRVRIGGSWTRRQYISARVVDITAAEQTPPEPITIKTEFAPANAAAPLVQVQQLQLFAPET
jgi:hypothetical protein